MTNLIQCTFWLFFLHFVLFCYISVIARYQPPFYFKIECRKRKWMKIKNWCFNNNFNLLFLRYPHIEMLSVFWKLDFYQFSTQVWCRFLWKLLVIHSWKSLCTHIDMSTRITQYYWKCFLLVNNWLIGIIESNLSSSI